jgi:exodeoxyribonuclease VII small subunit
MTARKQPALAETTFEDSLRRLEKIVEDLEGGEIPLEKAMQMYEEGVTLSKICAEKLTKAELALKRLSRDAEGNFTLMDEEE